MAAFSEYIQTFLPGLNQRYLDNQPQILMPIVVGKKKTNKNKHKNKNKNKNKNGSEIAGNRTYMFIAILFNQCSQ